MDGCIHFALKVGLHDLFGEDESPLDSKIVFLGKRNLEKLSGDKAYLDLWPSGKLYLTLTGLSPKSALALFDTMDKMKDEEIHGE